MQKPDAKSLVRIAVVLVDGFNLHELSRALAIFDLVNRTTAEPHFDISILTLDDGFAVSNWNVSVVPTNAICSAGLQDYMLLCAAERPAANPNRLRFLLRQLAERGALGLISSDRSAPDALVPNTLSWLADLAVAQGVDCHALEEAIKANRLYALNAAVSTALIARYCGPEVEPRVTWKLFNGELHDCDTAPARRPERLNEAIRIMKEHLEEPLSMREIGRRVGCSSRQLLRWFEAHLSTTPAQYYSALRLEHGRRLLLTSNMSVTEIALACGYPWVAQFSKAFRRRYGQSPRAARIEHLSNRTRDETTLKGSLQHMRRKEELLV